MLVLLGPTATGKSRLAVELAAQIKGEIISADSMQVYRGMDIGTAKPSVEERQAIPHHLIDIRNPDQAWTVADFIEETQRLVREIINNKHFPMIVGGTGLYLWSLIEGFSFPIVPADKELRTRLEEEPLANLYSRLSTIDPAAVEKIHSNDKKRIIRALEVYELTGSPISKLQKFGGISPHLRVGNHQPILVGLNLPREELYQRINQRVDQMIVTGLIEEVQALLRKGYAKDLPSFQALGYKEVVEFLEGKRTREQMIEELKKRTRHFARRQMTWFKRFKSVRWFEPPLNRVDIQTILDYIGEYD